MKESLINFDECNTIITNNSQNINNNTNNTNNSQSFSVNFSSSGNKNLNSQTNLSRISIMSTKDNPNEFETFNFDKTRKNKVVKFYGNYNNNSSNTNTNTIDDKSIKSDKTKKTGFSFIDKNNISINNSKTFINSNNNNYNFNDFNNNLNVSLLAKDSYLSKNPYPDLNEKEGNEKKNSYEGYECDYNYDNSNLIETPRDPKIRLLSNDENNDKIV